MIARNKGVGNVGVIDIFAGPGGLGEGFSSFEATAGSGRHPFELAVSAEMDKSAHSTLRLRAFSRMLEREGGAAVQAYRNFLIDVAKQEATRPELVFGSGRWARLWAEAEAEALNLTMGIAEHNALLNERIRNVRGRYDHLVLVGGPPCQAARIAGALSQGRFRQPSNLVLQGSRRVDGRDTRSGTRVHDLRLRLNGESRQ